MNVFNLRETYVIFFCLYLFISNFFIWLAVPPIPLRFVGVVLVVFFCSILFLPEEFRRHPRHFRLESVDRHQVVFWS